MACDQQRHRLGSHMGRKVIINDKHCFGLFGYDILFDERLKPWLLEVNASPSFSANTPADKDFKITMLSSALDVIDLEGQNHGDEIRVGGFDLIYAGGSPVDPGGGKRDDQRFYTTSLGTEIPQERIERMPCAPASNVTSSGARCGGASETTGRHPGFLMSKAARSGRGEVGGSGASRPSTRGNGREHSGGGVGGCGDPGIVAVRSSSSLGRGPRATTSDCSSRGESRGDGRLGRNEGGRRLPSRGSTAGVEQGRRERGGDRGRSGKGVNAGCERG